MKNLVIYHMVKKEVNCPDGVASAWICSRFLGENNADYLGWCYEFSDTPDVSNYERIFIVDFSFSAKILEEWADRGKNVTVIDHHKTALQDLSGLSDRITKRFDLDECGATLTWDYLFGFENKPIPAFLKYVRDRDLWNFQLSDTEIIHEAMSSFRYKLKPFGKPRLKIERNVELPPNNRYSILFILIGHVEINL